MKIEYFALEALLILTAVVPGDCFSPKDRDGCEPGATPSELRVDTTTRLGDLRSSMVNSAYVGGNKLSAYIVPSGDAHQSEYTSDYDKRRAFISGLSGSAGVAVVTTTQAAVWTDGRYFLQAENELDCNWILMKQDIEGTPTIPEWLGAVLKSGDEVGVDPTLVGKATFEDYESKLHPYGITMVPLERNLIDVIWTQATGRPEKKNTSLIVLDIKFAGKTWQDKIYKVRQSLTKKNADSVILTALDDIAWLFNLRGFDIPYNPMFYSYAVVTNTKIDLFVESKSFKLTENVRTHLNTNADGSCATTSSLCVTVKDYDGAIAAMGALSNDAAMTKIWLSPTSSYAIYNAIQASKRVMDYTPVANMKAVKNPTERQGMRNSQVRDSAALVDFIAFLEKEVLSGKNWTELSAQDKLEEYRRQQQYNMGLSFNTISAVGSNGAVIHYKSSISTNKQITTTEMYLLDSGGQYLDGTTDVTRTFHFGNPTEFEKEAYTRVLMGAINMASAVFPPVYGRRVSDIARGPLWREGLDYRHGTGHGIGMFLSVHEGPSSLKSSVREPDMSLREGMFFSDEPGYYEDGKFGVRLETIVMVTKAETKYNFGGYDYLTFEPVTFVPFEPKLINYDLMTVRQKQWLNNYHKLCLDKTGAELTRQGRKAGYAWLESRTRPVPVDATISGSLKHQMTVLPIFLLALLLSIIW